MEEKFNQWCLVELYGHSRMVGIVSEASIGGCSFIRVDVPEDGGHKAFTRYLGNNAIYSMNPITEEIGMALLKRIRPVPVHPYEITQDAGKLIGMGDDDG